MRKKKVAPAAVPYEPGLLEDLKDPEFAALYLTDCLQADDESFDLFFKAFLQVCKARGITVTAEKAKITRDALNKALTGHRNPTLKTFRSVLNSLDLDMQIVPLEHG